MVTGFQKQMSGKTADKHCVSFDDLTPEVIQYNFPLPNLLTPAGIQGEERKTPLLTDKSFKICGSAFKPQEHIVN